MIDGEERNLKLLDFGLAKVLDATGSRDGAARRPARARSRDDDDTSMGLGTPRYLPPERIAAGQYDARSDLYSAGIVLVKALTGDDPYDFGDGDEESILEAHLHQAPAPRWDRMRACDGKEALQAIALRLLAKDPRDRFPSAKAVREELSALLRGSVPPGSMMAARLLAERQEWKIRAVVEERKAPSRGPSPVEASTEVAPRAGDVTKPLGSPVGAGTRAPLLPPSAPVSPRAADVTEPLGQAGRALPRPDRTKPLGEGEAPSMRAPFPLATPRRSGWHEWVERPASEGMEENMSSKLKMTHGVSAIALAVMVIGADDCGVSSCTVESDLPPCTLEGLGGTWAGALGGEGGSERGEGASTSPPLARSPGACMSAASRRSSCNVVIVAHGVGNGSRI